jgi:hypothetical protein
MTSRDERYAQTVQKLTGRKPDPPPPKRRKRVPLDKLADIGLILQDIGVIKTNVRVDRMTWEIAIELAKIAKGYRRGPSDVR